MISPLGSHMNNALLHNGTRGERALSRSYMSCALMPSRPAPAYAFCKAKGSLGPGRSILNQVSNKLFGILEEAEQSQFDDIGVPACKVISAKLQLFIVCRLGKSFASLHCLYLSSHDDYYADRLWQLRSLILSFAFKTCILSETIPRLLFNLVTACLRDALSRRSEHSSYSEYHRQQLLPGDSIRYPVP